MPYPSNVATVTVNGTWIPSDGSASVPTGIVTFTPNVQLKDGATSQILEQVAIVAPLVNGSISVVLMATDDSHLSPSGWAYNIVERIDGQAAVSYSLQFPAAQTPVNLATKAPLVPVPGLVGYVALSSVAVPNGVASLDGTGNVPASQLGNAPGGVPSGTVVTETGYGQASTAGTATQYSRGDHTHGSPSLTSSAPTTSAVGDAAAVGTATTPARGDHTHGREAFAAPVASAVGDTQAAGTATSVARSDHRHARESFGAVTAQAQYGLASTSGAATTVARSDHAHGTPAWAATFPLSGYGLLAAAGDPAGFLSNGALGNGTIFPVRVWIPAGVAITNLWVAVRTAGTWDGSTTGNTIGLYDDTGTKIDNIADAGGLWTSAGWRGGALLGGAQAAQATDRFVYLVPLHRGMTVAPNLAMLDSPDDNHASWFDAQVGGGTKRRCLFLGGQSALPASFNPNSSGTATTFVPLVGVS